jgi:hypothetical protein
LKVEIELEPNQGGNMKDNVVSAASPTAQQLYLTLTKNLRAFGPFEVELKKSSVHLARTSAFCGVRFRQQYLLLTIKSAVPVKSERIARAEQVSKSRWHNDVRVSSDAEIDSQLVNWLKDAYDLSA